jgi:hypothetical protein
MCADFPYGTGVRAASNLTSGITLRDQGKMAAPRLGMPLDGKAREPIRRKYVRVRRLPWSHVHERDGLCVGSPAGRVTPRTYTSST